MIEYKCNTCKHAFEECETTYTLGDKIVIEMSDGEANLHVIVQTRYNPPSVQLVSIQTSEVWSARRTVPGNIQKISKSEITNMVGNGDWVARRE